MPKISVIVPIYKVEKYLRECVESILAQTFKDFELILVDDGSPDGCGAICDEYRSRDDRVVVIHKQNGGVTAARRAGVECSRGEWIMFVDGDDVLAENALEVLVSYANNDVSIVEGTYSRFIEKNEFDTVLENEKNSPASVLYEDFGRGYAEGMLHGKYASSPCLKIIFSKLLKDGDALNVPQDIWMGEDSIMCVRIGAHPQFKKIVKINKTIYGYRMREGSATTMLVLESENLKIIDFLKDALRRCENDEAGIAEHIAPFAYHRLQCLMAQKLPYSAALWADLIKPAAKPFHKKIVYLLLVLRIPCRVLYFLRTCYVRIFLWGCRN